MLLKRAQLCCTLDECRLIDDRLLVLPDWQWVLRASALGWFI
jgi:hypothetical protein